VGQLESPSGTEMSPCLRVANLQKIFLYRLYDIIWLRAWLLLVLPPPCFFCYKEILRQQIYKYPLCG
jgi:hypothetical protein